MKRRVMKRRVMKRRVMKRLSLLVIILIMSVATMAAGEEAVSSHPFSIDDMLAMRRISEPQVSPDGKNIVFGLKTIDLKENKGMLMERQIVFRMIVLS